MRQAPLAAALLLSSSLLACSAREPTPARTPPMTTMRDAAPGSTITIRGRASSTPWQHMILDVPGKSDGTFDLEGGSEQTIVYWKDPPTCAGAMIVTGKVLEANGARRGGKGGEIRELQLDVESARCVE